MLVDILLNELMAAAEGGGRSRKSSKQSSLLEQRCIISYHMIKEMFMTKRNSVPSMYAR
jgi:hypothetical protein